MVLKSPFTYNQQFCIKQCRQKSFIDKCNCSDATIFSIFNNSDCISISEIKCISKAKETVYEKNYTDYNCISQCPLECNSTKYKATLSSNKLIGDLYAQYIKENVNLSKDFVKRPIDSNTAQQSIVKVNIFYENLSYLISIDTPQMDVVSLLAYIGGIMGLFLGISVFSFFEVFILLIEM